MNSLLFLIAKRDFLTRSRSRAFQLSTLALILGLAAITFLNWRFGGEDGPTEAVIGLTAEAEQYATPLDADTDELATTIVIPANEDDVRGGAVDVLFDGSSVIWDGEPWLLLDAHLNQIVTEIAVLDKASEAGLTPEELGALFAVPELDQRRLDGSDDDDNEVRLLTAFLSGLATFLLIQVWGSFVTMGVVEEKATRVVEILLAQVEPVTLLGGKILGIGALAVLQLSVVVAGLVAALSFTQQGPVPTEVWASLPLLLVTFLLGFAFYATFFAAVGSTVSRQEDASSVQLPAILPLVVGWFITTTGFASPESMVVTIASFVPFTSPIVMPTRYALGAMSTWEVAVSLALLAASAVVMVRFAAAIYRYTLLRTGAPVSLRHAWRSRRTAELGSDAG